jgi:hypothetical protein
MHLLKKSRYFLLLIVLLFLLPGTSHAQISVGVAIHIGPPALPVYAQPPCPQEGFLWTPGYWAYGSMGYYWVPGVWVAAPQPGFLWTPGYWGFAGGVYGWHGGYWGPHVGFYGGINYGFGYGGVGFVGGEWAGGAFRYNTAVMNVNTTVVHNTYINKTVINNTTVVNHAAFNGPGGVAARPTAQEESYAHENHIQPTANQLSHEKAASADRSQWASSNHGKPGNVAMDRVGGHSFNQQGHAANTAAAAKPAANDRAANGGKPTPAEHTQTNHQQNNVSHNAPAERSGQKTNNNVAAEHKSSSAKPAPQQKQASKPQNKPSHENQEKKAPKK